MASNRNQFVAFLLVVLILSTLSVNAVENDQISYGLTAQPYTIEQNEDYDSIHMDGFYTRGLPGAPKLPQQTYDIELPSDVMLETVHIEIQSRDTEIIDGEYEIEPAPPYTTGSSPMQFYTVKNEKDLAIYGKDEFYPVTPVEMLRTYQVRDKKIVRIQFTPFQYNPVIKKIQLNTTVNVTISWGKGVPWYGSPPSQGWSGYAIVTTNAIVNNSQNFAAFVTSLQQRGFNVVTITETQYGVATGQARAVNIRNWLTANYIPLQLQYVLLIGDPDPDDPTIVDSFGDVPMMMCWPNPGSSPDQTPTDYFYADLTGNWDSDGDTLYGEYGQDTVDMGPEVYVGRIPVYDSDYTTLDKILWKSLSYTCCGAKNILLPMARSDDFTDGRDLPETVIKNIANPNGYSTYTMYETAGDDPVPTTAYGYSAPITQSNVIQEWAKKYCVVFWWGHGGNSDAWRWYRDGGSVVWKKFLSSNDSVANANTFTFQCSCNNGWPEDKDNLGYALLKNGAICTVSSSRVSWYYAGKWSFNGTFANSEMGYIYVDHLINGKEPAGKALYDGKNSLTIPGWVGYQNFFDFNLYGDPSLALVPCAKQPPPLFTPVNWNKVVCPLAKYRIEITEGLLEEALRLLQEAIDAGKNVSEIEPLIYEAEEAIEKANMYCTASNCIAGNYWALRAITLLEEAIEKLNALP